MRCHRAGRLTPCAVSHDTVPLFWMRGFVNYAELLRDVEILRAAIPQDGVQIQAPPELDAARTRLNDISGLNVIDLLLRNGGIRFDATGR